MYPLFFSPYICTICMPTGIYNNVHFILLTLSYVQCHVYLLVYTIMYMLYYSHFMICTVSCIPTGIYNNVHPFFFSSYHMYHVIYTYEYIQ